ncbi:MAG: DUF2383 domain-containing protein [Methylococcales bacterium]|nr:DUF2383 domain-containing protein [Methylococcales bacterium]
MFDIETLNKLLIDELSATETYQETLDKLQADAELGNALQSIYNDHQQAVSILQDRIRQLDAVPAESSGTWGTVAEVVQEGANLLGKKATLMVLHRGERSGAEDYEKALADPELPAEVRILIETRLLPARQSHTQILEGLLEMEMAA